jgi:hypothetical protein
MLGSARLWRQDTVLWIVCLAVVGLGVGIWAGFTPPVGNVLTPLAAALLIASGLVLLSPFATSPPVNERQQKVRRCISLLGAGNIMNGIALLMSSSWASMALMGVGAALALMALVIGRSVISRPTKNPEAPLL